MNEKQIQALIKKMAKNAKPKSQPARWTDPTVVRSEERDDSDAKEIFKEMKKREF